MTIHDINFKDEFNYYAVSLIFGKNSPKMSEFSIYKIDNMLRHKSITFSEVSGLTPENVNDINRRLVINKYRSFIANNCKLSSGVCRTISYEDTLNKVHYKDSIFSVDEYEYFSGVWDTNIKSKIRTLGILIRSIYGGDMHEIPLLMNEFPNITGFLFKHPGLWIKDEFEGIIHNKQNDF